MFGNAARTTGTTPTNRKQVPIRRAPRLASREPTEVGPGTVIAAPVTPRAAVIRSFFGMFLEEIVGTQRQGFRVVAEVLEFFQLFLVRIVGVRQNGDVAHGIRESHAAHKLFSGHGFEWLVIWVAHCHASLGVPVFQALDAMNGGQDHASDSLKVVHDWSGGILLLKLAFPSQGDNLHSDGPAVDSSHEVFQ